ncbi:D-alanine--D-alanine ligase [Paraneptunicella aestuarii]|uniref:D-alanine--D-alanine ligase n=1 Tax=Paraneptunicella aestuarii TaxID=2831148 RepID=UPI001E631877|nr:D-alanine--D-alanine ligase [Paraneptunicella aestuarii]UAA38087.1 D-alanine--D-alanine ligase [Paraneptunicella aestuarii]
MVATTRNVKEFGKVAVLMGGDSAEREVSLRSGSAVLAALQGAGLDVHRFDPRERPITELVTDKFDRVFIILHGRGGEDGTLQGALDCMKIPYTGSGVLGSALSMDKIRSKQIFQATGLPTADYRVIRQHESVDLAAVLEELGGTVMVKPSLEGSSIGMAKVSSVEDFEHALQEAFKYDSNVLVERFVNGKEFTVSILADKALPSISMTTPRVFYDYTAKYESNKTEYHCPGGLPAEAEKKLGELAVKAYKALGASGWGRVDFMQSQQGEMFILEANTVPGMTEKSLVPMAAKQSGLNFKELCLTILETSFRTGA